MAELTRVRRPDGSTCPAYVSPEQVPPGAPGLVVIQEWWGLNEQIRKTADRFARAGYRAIVPDLYRGKRASNADEASHMMQQLNFLDAAEQDIQGCVDFLRESCPRVGVTGFCMGGALTILSALRVKGVDAAVCFYGVPPKAVANPAELAVPMQLHFAEQDDWCTAKVVDDLEAALKQSRSRFELYRYPAQHAFMNEARPEVYDARCAGEAWERTLRFLERALKAPSSAR